MGGDSLGRDASVASRPCVSLQSGIRAKGEPMAIHAVTGRFPASLTSAGRGPRRSSSPSTSRSSARMDRPSQSPETAPRPPGKHDVVRHGSALTVSIISACATHRGSRGVRKKWPLGSGCCRSHLTSNSRSRTYCGRSDGRPWQIGTKVLLTFETSSAAHAKSGKMGLVLRMRYGAGLVPTPSTRFACRGQQCARLCLILAWSKSHDNGCGNR